MWVWHAHSNQDLCQDLFLGLCSGGWGTPATIKRWTRGQWRREFGAPKSHLPPFKVAGPEVFHYALLTYQGLWFPPILHRLLSPMAHHLFPGPHGLWEEKGRKEPGEGKHKQNSSRSSWVTCWSILHSFHWPYSAFNCCLLQSPSPPPAHGSSSQLHSSWPLALAASSLLSWLGQPLLSPSSPLSLCCLPCLFWTQILHHSESHTRAWDTGIPFQALL